MSDKIINFQQRRELEQAILKLAETPNEVAVADAARRIMQEFSAEAVLPALLKHLETADSQLRGGLGYLAALLPSDIAIEALRTATADRRRSPLARMTAAAIAQRFLGVEFPAALTSDLGGADEAAQQSLREAIEAGKRNRHVLLEYVEQMRQLGEEIAFLVLGALGRIAPVDQVDLLRLIALDTRPRVSKAALAALEALSSTAAGLAAVRALHAVQPLLPAELAAQAARGERKLRMAGHRYEPPSTDGWRALLSPSDPNGNQVVWLVKMPPENGPPGVLLGLTVNLGAGIVRFFGSETVDGSVLPARQAVGNLLTVENDTGESSVVLEAPFDYGRWLVWQALRAHLATDQTQPIPGELQLYSDQVTQFGPPQVDDALLAYWHSPPSNNTQLDKSDLETATAELFAHPALAHWLLPGRAILQATPAAQRPDPQLPLSEIVQVLLREIERWPESAALAPSLERALRGQAVWLHVAGHPTLAGAADRLARAMPVLAVPDNPVLAHMLAVGLGRPRPNRKA